MATELTHNPKPIGITDNFQSYKTVDYGSQWNGQIIDYDDLFSAMSDSDLWNDIDESWWRKACDEFGLDFNSFDDGQDLFDALEKAYRKD